MNFFRTAMRSSNLGSNSLILIKRRSSLSVILSLLSLFLPERPTDRGSIRLSENFRHLIDLVPDIGHLPHEGVDLGVHQAFYIFPSWFLRHISFPTRTRILYVGALSANRLNT